MKTIKEKLLEMKSEFDSVGTKFNGLTWKTIARYMNEYATEYAKEALKNASENVTYILDANDEVHIIKSSILSEDNLPKHR